MKGDGVLNLLIFQAFQDVRMASSLVRSSKTMTGEGLSFVLRGAGEART